MQIQFIIAWSSSFSDFGPASHILVLKYQWILYWQLRFLHGISIYNHIPMTLFGDFFHHFGVFLYLFLIATSPKRIKIEIPLYIPKSRRSIIFKMLLQIKLKFCKLEFHKYSKKIWAVPAFCLVLADCRHFKRM